MVDLRSLETSVREMVKAGRGLVAVRNDLSELKKKLPPDQQRELDGIIAKLTENVQSVATSATSTGNTVEQLVKTVR